MKQDSKLSGMMAKAYKLGEELCSLAKDNGYSPAASEESDEGQSASDIGDDESKEPQHEFADESDIEAEDAAKSDSNSIADAVMLIRKAGKR